MIKGDFRILYIKVGEEYIPLGCLTSNSFSENLDLLDTTTRENGGWRTSIPNIQGFSCEFEGFQERIGDLSTILSYNDIKELKRAKTLIDFRLETEVNNIVERETFKGYIVDLSESATVGELLTYSASITGVGVPVSEIIITKNNFIFEDGNNFIFEDGNNLIFEQ